MDFDIDLKNHKILALYGEPDSGKTQLALRLAVISERPIVYLDCACALSKRDLACAGIPASQLFLRLRPEHIEDATGVVLRCLDEIPDSLLIIDPLTALRPKDYEIGGTRGVLRAQVAFLNHVLAVLFASDTKMILVEHGFVDGAPPVATLFADYSQKVTAPAIPNSTLDDEQ